MKILIHLFGFLLLFVNPWSKEMKFYQSDSESMNLIGKVSQIQEYTYKAIVQGDSIVKGIRQHPSSYSYDKLYNFDRNGNIVIEQLLDTQDSLYLFNVYFYKKDQLYESRYISAERNSLISNDIYKYDYNKKTIKKQNIGPFESKGLLSIFRYDKDNRLIENIDTSSSYYSQIVFKYNKYGQVIESIENVLSDSLYFKTNYEYKSKESQQPNKEILHFENSRQVKYYLYEDDSLGNMLTMKGYNSQNELVYSKEYSYKYDKVGNWIQRTHTEFGIPKFIVERRIFY